MQRGICKLCLLEKDLENSHILSEFLYKRAYCSKHKFIACSSNPAAMLREHQKGFREYLLCGECEDRFEKHETYVAALLQKIERVEPTNEKPQVIDFEYHHLKLFGLSILWRSHISTRYDVRGVDLGDDAEKIRFMLLADDPGDSLAYGFSMTRLAGSMIAAQSLELPHKGGSFSDGMPAIRSIRMQARGIEWRFAVCGQMPADANDTSVVGFDLKRLTLPVRILNDDFHEIMLRSQLDKWGIFDGNEVSAKARAGFNRRSKAG